MIDLTYGFENRFYFHNIQPGQQYIADLYKKYIENLGKFLTLTYSEPIFLSAFDLEQNFVWGDDKENSFVSEGMIKLGQSIVNNGTYWPFFHTFESGKIKITEGLHRIMALRAVGSSAKFLSIRNIPNPDPLCRFSYWMLWPSEKIDILKKDSSIFSVYQIQNDLYEVVFYDSAIAYKFLIIYSMFLSEMLFRISPTIAGASCINYKQSFRIWYHNQIKGGSTL